jgi:hypothetical protein
MRCATPGRYVRGYARSGAPVLAQFLDNGAFAGDVLSSFGATRLGMGAARRGLIGLRDPVTVVNNGDLCANPVAAESSAFANVRCALAWERCSVLGNSLCFGLPPLVPLGSLASVTRLGAAHNPGSIGIGTKKACSCRLP